MVSRHCTTCNAIESTEHALKTCPACKRVAYCDHACQKKDWPFHKPACLAVVQKNQYSDEDSDEAEVENNPEEEAVKLTTSSKVAVDDFIVDDETHADAAYPVGTYIEWFVIPTPDYPDGCKTTIKLDKTMVTFLAALSEEESKKAERQMVEGVKLGLEPLEVFRQIVKAKKELLRVYEERAQDFHAFETALQTLAGRHHAASHQGGDIPMRDGTRAVGFNKGEDLVLLGVNGHLMIVQANWAQVMELEEGVKHGEQEMVFFDSDTITNMKYLRAYEKKAYKEMLAQRKFEQRYPGKTMAEVAADKKKRRAEVQAATEETSVEQESVENDLAAMDLGQQ